MDDRRKTRNVRALARQLVLSGCGNSIQSKDIYSDGDETIGRRAKTTKEPQWEQTVYRAAVSFVIEQVSVGSDKHEYKIFINDDADLSLCTYAKRGKKATSDVFTVPQAKSQTKTLAMVYGVHKSGELSLSLTARQEGVQNAADVYSWLLGQIDDAVQFRLQRLEEQAHNDDPAKRDKGTLPQENVGEHQAPRRRKTVRTKIRTKTIPEDPSVLVGVDGQVLGMRPGNGQYQPEGLGDNPGHREDAEGDAMGK